MILIAYYDASSHEGDESEPLVVAGLLATQESWVEFDRAWSQVLGAFGASHLHMKDCAQWKGDFAAWDREESKRALFLGSLIDVMKRAVSRAFVFRLIPADYNAVSAEYAMENDFWSGAYSLAAMMCTHQAERWRDKHHPHARLAHVLEHGDAGQGVVADFINKVTEFGEADLFPLSIRPKRDPKTGDWLRPFEACDLVAYEHRLAVGRKIKGKDPFGRKSFRAILGQIKCEAVFLDQPRLIRWCHAHPEAYPRRDGQPSPPLDVSPEVAATLNATKAKVARLKTEFETERAALRRMQREQKGEARDA